MSLNVKVVLEVSLYYCPSQCISVNTGGILIAGRAVEVSLLLPEVRQQLTLYPKALEICSNTSKVSAYDCHISESILACDANIGSAPARPGSGDYLLMRGHTGKTTTRCNVTALLR
jgi:hypothetical protein